MSDRNALTAAEREQLLGKASGVATQAYAPHSKFRVGAAVLGKNNVYLGTNVENASYGLTLCAERSAFAAAVTAGEKNIRAIAIACIDAEAGSDLSERMPCGACRQWLQELAPEAEILVLGFEQPFQLSDLLPKPFKLAVTDTAP
jgi:cytidine deaminase